MTCFRKEVEVKVCWGHQEVVRVSPENSLEKFVSERKLGCVVCWRAAESREKRINGGGGVSLRRRVGFKE